MKTLDQNSEQIKQDINTLVFEGRNKAYGAYYIRLHNFRWTKNSLIAGFIIFIFLLNLPGLLKDLLKKNENAIEISVPVNTADHNLSTLPPPPENNINSNKNPLAGIIKKSQGPAKSHTDSIAAHLLKDTLEIKNDSIAIDTSLPERLPMFPGGNKLLADYIHTHLVYPTLDRNAGIHGIQYVFFSINEDGSLEDIEALDALSIPIGHAAEDLVSGMPKWWPAKHLNKKIKTRVKIPIVFQKP